MDPLIRCLEATPDIFFVRAYMDDLMAATHIRGIDAFHRNLLMFQKIVGFQFDMHHCCKVEHTDDLGGVTQHEGASVHDIVSNLPIGGSLTINGKPHSRSMESIIKRGFP